jgi:hypothetical protein
MFPETRKPKQDQSQDWNISCCSARRVSLSARELAPHPRRVARGGTSAESRKGKDHCNPARGGCRVSQRCRGVPAIRTSRSCAEDLGVCRGNESPSYNRRASRRGGCPSIAGATDEGASGVLAVAIQVAIGGFTHSRERRDRDRTFSFAQDNRSMVWIGACVQRSF